VYVGRAALAAGAKTEGRPLPLLTVESEVDWKAMAAMPLSMPHSLSLTAEV